MSNKQKKIKRIKMTMKKLTVLALIFVLVLSLCSCGESKKIDEVERLIENLGEITLESEDAVKDARSAFDELSSKGQDKVVNAHTLFEAEDKLGELKALIITDFESVKLRLMNGLDAKDCDSFYKTDKLAATFAFASQLEVMLNDYFDVSETDFEELRICIDRDDECLELLMPHKGGNIYCFRFWPADAKAEFGTVPDGFTCKEYAEKIKDAGFIDEYKLISVTEYLEVMEQMSQFLPN